VVGGPRNGRRAGPQIEEQPVALAIIIRSPKAG
jgi:hypothetical protein